MLSVRKGATTSLLPPFEAGIVNNNGLNQTCHTISKKKDIVTAVTYEKTAGWLLEGKTITNVKMGKRAASEEDWELILQNPLWTREIRLAEHQVEKYWPPAEDEYGTADYNRMLCDEEIDPRCVQWLPKGIRYESAFNCFVAKEADEPETRSGALTIIQRRGVAGHYRTLLQCVSETVKNILPRITSCAARAQGEAAK